jgi:arabinofuranan 3-O-arabinosyltransferase
LTKADPDRPGRAAAGSWHPFGLSGGTRAGVADMATTIPSLRIGRSPAAVRPRPGTVRDRWWFLIAFLVALAIFAATDSGRIVFDTKLGVDINAAEFIHRLWSLWNPLEWFGSLQNQYIGYAIPMAPFYLAGQLLHVPIWLIERLWLALIIAVGFAGMVKLARALGVGSDSSRLVAGAVFALWPTFTIAIGSTSSTALPGLLAPWAVLPLVTAVHGRSTPGRAAARSGLAIVAMAGVNAVCTLDVLLLPALYILTHTTGRQRVTMGLKWSIAVVAAIAWWAIPLLLQGRYSFNFLPYIEQSATTSRTMSAAAVLRGTGTWTAYFNVAGSPWLQGGWIMVTSSGAILASAAISAAGLAGLARRDMPERRWLCMCAGVAAVLTLAGYYGPLGGPFHTQVAGLFDAAFAPFRSTYKLEPVLAVALALGCAHLLERCWRLSIPLRRKTRLALSLATAPLIALVLIGFALPQLTARSLQAGSFTGVPAYWYSTARFLSAHSPQNTALVVPANPHGQFTWGDTIDDPLEPLASSPWVERGLVPFGGAGSQVLLQTAEQAVESGQQVPGLAAYLARAGIRYVVVRNDADPTISGHVAPQVVNETLALSGFRRVAAFGPPVAASLEYPNVAGQTPGFAPTYPAVEIFTANNPQLRPSSPVTALPVTTTVLVNGGPDSLLQLAGQGILRSQPTVIAGQALASEPALWAVTDGQQRADTAFGSTNAYMSYTYTATEDNPVDDPLGGGGGPPRQLLPVAAAGHQTVAVISGAASVTASSAGTWFGESTQYDPVNAFDGDPATAWAESSPTTPVGQWIQINFSHPINLPARAVIRLLDDSYSRSIANQLRVTTADGTATTETFGIAAEQPLQLPPGPTRWLRITITGASNVVPGNPGAGISDVLLPGVQLSTFLQPPEERSGSSAPAVSYSFAQPEPTGNEDLNRTFVTTADARLTANITALPQPGAALDSLLTRLSPATKSAFAVTASSIWGSLPEFGPRNLFQKGGKPWLAGAGDASPALTVTWHGRRTIRKLRLQPAFGLAAAPTGVLIGSPAGARLASVEPGGVVRVSPPLRTDKLYLTFSAPSTSAAGNTAAGQPAQLPLGLASLSIPGLSGLHIATPRPTSPFRLACGQGPVVSLGGHSYQTSVRGTIGSLTQLGPVQLRLCTPGGAITLPAGRQWLTAAPSADFVITSLSLSSQPAAAVTTSAAPSRSVRVLTWQSDRRSLRIGPGRATYVEIHENFSPGWTASMGGQRLTAAVLDGWQQAFVVPAGRGGTITLTFAPAAAYHAGLIISGIALLILAFCAIGTGRRRRGRARTSSADTLARPQPSPTAIGIALGVPALVFGARQGPGDASFRVGRRAPSSGMPGSHNGRHQAAGRGRIEVPAAPAVPRLSHADTAKGLSILMPLAAVIFVAGGALAMAVPILAIIDNWRARWRPAIAAGAMLCAGVVAATASTPTLLGDGPFSGLAQACALVALAAALLPAFARRGAKSSRADAGRTKDSGPTE